MINLFSYLIMKSHGMTGCTKRLNKLQFLIVAPPSRPMHVYIIDQT